MISFATIFKNKKLNLPLRKVEEIIERNGAEPWFAYVLKERDTRWEIIDSSYYIARKLKRKSNILETGCGVGSNLAWFGQIGFKSLYGTDASESAILAAKEISKLANLDINFEIDDGLNPEKNKNIKFDAIFSLNWTYLVKKFNFEEFLDIYKKYLSSNGYLIIDVIDDSYSLIDKNKYLTSDWNKPVFERGPSEYIHRYSYDNVSNIASKHGFKVDKYLSGNGVIPRKVYILKKKI